MDCPYIPRENGGQGLIGVEECVRVEEMGLTCCAEFNSIQFNSILFPLDEVTYLNYIH